MLGGPDRWVAECNDEIDILSDEFAGQRGGALAAALGPNEQEADIASLFPADCPHVTPEWLSKDLKNILRIGPQHADDRHLLLRAPRAATPRPYRLAA
jgi:hypothetical protein